MRVEQHARRLIREAEELVANGLLVHGRGQRLSEVGIGDVHEHRERLSDPARQGGARGHDRGVGRVVTAHRDELPGPVDAGGGQRERLAARRR